MAQCDVSDLAGLCNVFGQVMGLLRFDSAVVQRRRRCSLPSQVPDQHAHPRLCGQI